MIFKKDDSPIDGEKLNRLLLEIRSGKSKYIEFEINELVKKSLWRKYKIPIWSWIPGTILLFTALLSSIDGKGNPIVFILALIIFFLPFIGMSMANAGYRSFNQLKSILKSID